jgi:flagellar assembly factor FliW
MSVTAAAALPEPAMTPTQHPFADPEGTMLATRFGMIRMDPERLLSFPSGLPGFPGSHRFQLERITGSPVLLLQSLDDGAVAFFVMPIPRESDLVRSADRSATCHVLALDPDHADYLAVVTARQGSEGLELFANLRAPIVIDTQRRIGTQIVLADSSYSLRHRVLPSN